MAKDHGPSIKDDKQYEGLRKKGMSKQRAAAIANSPGAEKRGGKKAALRRGDLRRTESAIRAVLEMQEDVRRGLGEQRRCEEHPLAGVCSKRFLVGTICGEERRVRKVGARTLLKNERRHGGVHAPESEAHFLLEFGLSLRFELAALEAQRRYAYRRHGGKHQRHGNAEHSPNDGWPIHFAGAANM